LSIIRGEKILWEMPSKLKKRTHAGSGRYLGSCRRQRFLELEFFCCPLHRPLRGALKRVKNGKLYLIPRASKPAATSPPGTQFYAQQLQESLRHQQHADDTTQPITLPVLPPAGQCSSPITCSDEPH
jgi:hypothetical protein